eukprot:TRINITY_DN2575_c0_g1_i1.p1 TRINITY_DN2575_c0_g1~~TRINITY_DN2575_c0_g1_i1.p1  ORF type:complete len:135 (-),score=2.24 TRINITY_DN2575_c0_g1_i1:48-452(-)
MLLLLCFLTIHRASGLFWTLVCPNGADCGDAPGPKRRSEAGMAAASGLLHVFGGSEVGGNSLNDLWRIEFDEASPTWQEICPNGGSCNAASAPPARYAANFGHFVLQHAPCRFRLSIVSAFWDDSFRTGNFLSG